VSRVRQTTSTVPTTQHGQNLWLLEFWIRPKERQDETRNVLQISCCLAADK
jgi:hypothetical protein